MRCDSCKREVEQPLELYDGSWACNFCRKKLVNEQPEFRITKKNDSLFKLSEIYYYQWLTESAAGDFAADVSLIENAVELCKSAAMTGHPEAILKMGYYYDKDYVEANRGEDVRCRIAYAYYSSVCFNNSDTVNVEEGADYVDIQALKIKAATLMLRMLAAAPPELRISPSFRFEDVKAAVRNRLGVEVEPGFSEPVHINKSEQTFRILQSFDNTMRAPVLGIFRLSGAELKALFSIRDGNLTATRMAEKRLWMDCIPCTSDGRVGQTENFVALSNNNRIKQVLSGIDDEDCLYLRFINDAGNHVYLGRQDLNAVSRAFRKNEDALTKRLINGGGQMDYTLFDDDFYMYMEGFKTARKAAVKLVENICIGGGTK